MNNPNFNTILSEALAKQKRITNADNIRAMSDEKLAEYLFDRGNGCEYCFGICAYQYECEEDHAQEFCIEQIVKWLRQEAMEDK